MALKDFFWLRWWCGLKGELKFDTIDGPDCTYYTQVAQPLKKDDARASITLMQRSNKTWANFFQKRWIERVPNQLECHLKIIGVWNKLQQTCSQECGRLPIMNITLRRLGESPSKPRTLNSNFFWNRFWFLYSFFTFSGFKKVINS